MRLPDLPETLPRRVELRTRWNDEDNQGVLNNAVYLTLFEEARHAQFRGTPGLVDNRFPFLLVQSALRFVRPGVGGVAVTVESGTVAIGRSSFEQVYRVRGPEGETWCEGRAWMVCHDPEAGGSRPIPDDLRAVLEASRVEDPAAPPG